MIENNSSAKTETNLVVSSASRNRQQKIKTNIGLLVQQYVRCPEPDLAESIAKQINEVLACPGWINDAEQRCLYRQLEMHWRCLSWINRKQWTTKYSWKEPESGACS